MDHPAYAMFMALPWYIYLAEDVSPNGIITVSGDFKYSHDCEVANVNINKFELSATGIVELEKVVDPEEAPLSKKVNSASTDRQQENSGATGNVVKTAEIGTDLSSA